MLDTKDLEQVRKYVIKMLPELIRTDPEIATTIEGILAEHFPRRDEFGLMMDELRQSRKENKERFEQVDQRFEQVDQRFEQVDQRFEQVDQRFEQVDQRFEQVDQRFEEASKERLGIRRDIAQLQSTQESLRKTVEGQEAWLKFTIGDLRSEKGKSLEDVAAAGLRYGLKNPDIKAESILLRQDLIDTEGTVFPKGYKTEVDLVAEDNRLIVFEVKATAKPSEVDLFAYKVNLVEHQHPEKNVHGVFINLGAQLEVRERCEEREIELLD